MNRQVMLLSALALGIGILLTLVRFRGENPPTPEGANAIHYASTTMLNPSQGLPVVHLSSSNGAVTFPHADWGANQSPTFTVYLEKLKPPASGTPSIGR